MLLLSIITLSFTFYLLLYLKSLYSVIMLSVVRYAEGHGTKHSVSNFTAMIIL
jgi:hypothetical protein